MSVDKLLGLVLILAAAQGPSLTGQFQDSVEVRVLEIDAVVTDNDGDRVRGLGSDDFELFINGRARVITHFTEYSTDERVRGTLRAGQQAETETPVAETPAPARQPRTVGIFIDRLEMNPFERDRLFQGLDEFLESSLGPDDRLIIAWWQGGFPVIEQNGYTENARAALDLIRKWSGFDTFGRAQDAAFREEVSVFATRQADMAAIAPRLPGGKPDVRSYDPSGDIEFSDAIEKMRFRREMMVKLSAMTGFVRILSAADGRKSAVLVTNRFRRRFAMEPNTLPDRKVFEGFDALATEANAGGVTLNGFWVGRNNPNDCVSAETPGNASTLNCFGALEMRRLGEGDALLVLAERTGGVAATGVGVTLDQLETIERDLSSYYSVAFRAEPDEKALDVELRPRDRSLRVRARSSIVRRSWSDELETRNEMNLLIADAGDFEVGNAFEEWRKKGRRFEHDVVLRIPASALTPLRTGRQESVSLQIVVTSRDDDGATETNVLEPVLPVTSEQLRQLDEIEYVVTLLGDRKPRRVSVAVVDTATRTVGFTSFDLLPPEDR